MHRPRPRLQLVLVTLLALVSAGALATTRPPLTGTVWSHGDELTLAVAWLVAFTASAWLFVATGACLVALGTARPALARRLAPTLPVGVRKLVEVAIAGSCIVLPALPAWAAAPPAGAAVVVDDQPVVRAPEAVAPEGGAPQAAAPAPSDPVPRSAPQPTVPAPSTAPRRHVVRAGDNLWLIARASLMHTSGGRPSEAAVARYWHEVIRANRSTLRSGDPSLIYPGEVVTLPPPSAVS